MDSSFVGDEELFNGNWNVCAVSGNYNYQKYYGAETGRKANRASSVSDYDFFVCRIEAYGILGNVDFPYFLGNY